MDRNDYPLVHIYPQTGPRQAARIIGNTEGLLLLVNTLVAAISSSGEGVAEVFCVDAEDYELLVIRDDSETAWETLNLPYVKEYLSEVALGLPHAIAQLHD